MAKIVTVNIPSKAAAPVGNMGSGGVSTSLEEARGMSAKQAKYFGKGKKGKKPKGGGKGKGIVTGGGAAAM